MTQLMAVANISWLILSYVDSVLNEILLDTTLQVERQSFSVAALANRS